MLRLPQELRVQLVDGSMEPVRVSDVLIAIRFSHRGHYYYGDLVGLTDSDGIARTTAQDLQARFDQNRHLFPMDYRRELGDCDPQVDLVVLDSEIIRERLQVVPGNAMISPDARVLYARAHNERVGPVVHQADLSEAEPTLVKVLLPTTTASDR